MKKMLLCYLIFGVVISAFGQAVVPGSICGSAIPVTISDTGLACVTGTTIGASVTTWASPAPCGQATWHSVWYTFTSTGTENVVVVTPNGTPAAQQLALSVYTGTCDNPVPATGSCSIATSSNPDTVIYAAPTGTQFYVEVGDFETAGPYELCIKSFSPGPTPGNSCATATRLCTLNPFVVDTIPVGGNNFTPDCFGGITPDDGQWYQFTVSVTGQAVWKCKPTYLASDTSHGITPGNGIELDWAMYDISNGCPTTANPTTGEIACNYNYEGENSDPIGMSYSTNNCANGVGPQIGTAAGEFCPPATLVAGHTYAIFINNYSYDPVSHTGTTGWDFNFIGSTFQLTPQDSFSISPDSICGTISITNYHPGIWQVWSFGDSTTDSSSNPITHHYTQSGTYVVTLEDSDAAGCLNITSEVVTVDTGNLTVYEHRQICPGVLITLTAPYSNINTYLWSTGATSQSITVMSDTSIQYSVNSILTTGCNITDFISVVVSGNPIVTISGDNQICNGETITLNASGGNTYSWSNNLGDSASVSFSPGSTNTYYVTATWGTNCTATAAQTVVVLPELNSAFSQTICSGFDYNFNGQILTRAGIYRDSIQTEIGCDSVVTLHLFIDSIIAPVITRNGDTLQTQSFSSYQWKLNGAYIGGANSQNLVITQNGDYTVLVTDSNDCYYTSGILTVTALGIPNINTGYNIKLFPNPNTGTFTLEFSDNETREIEITDAVGRIVMPAVKITQQKYFNLDALANGIYILRINQNNEVRSLKFSVVR